MKARVLLVTEGRAAVKVLGLVVLLVIAYGVGAGLQVRTLVAMAKLSILSGTLVAAYFVRHVYAWPDGVVSVRFGHERFMPWTRVSSVEHAASTVRLGFVDGTGYVLDADTWGRAHEIAFLVRERIDAAKKDSAPSTPAHILELARHDAGAYRRVELSTAQLVDLVEDGRVEEDVRVDAARALAEAKLDLLAGDVERLTRARGETGSRALRRAIVVTRSAAAARQ